jgi:hypothetical protein
MINKFDEARRLMETNFDNSLDKLSEVGNCLLFNLKEKKDDVKLVIENCTNNEIKDIEDRAIRLQNNVEVLNERITKFGEALVMILKTTFKLYMRATV